MRKYKPVDKTKSDNEPKPKDVKLELDTFEDSEIEKIIKGDRSEINVLYEDDKMIAYEELPKLRSQKITKEHFKVIAKEKRLTSL